MAWLLSIKLDVVDSRRRRSLLLVGALLCARCGEDEWVDKGGDSPATAGSIDIGPGGATGILDSPEAEEFFRLEARSGDWLRIKAETVDEMPPRHSLEVFLYGPDQTRVAHGPYSALDTHIGADGTYYIGVIGSQTTIGGPPATGTHYRVIADALVSGEGSVVIDSELGDDASHAQPASLGASTVLGTFHSAGDLDVYSFTVFDGDLVALDVFFGATGPDGSGSTAEVGSVYVTDTAGLMLGRLTASGTQLHLQVPLEAGDYLLWIQPPLTNLGANPFYDASVFSLEMRMENENIPGANDTAALAESSGEVFHVESYNPTFYFFLPDGDVDYLGLDIDSQADVNILCEGPTAGSGLSGLDVDLLNASGSLMDGSAPANNTPAYIFEPLEAGRWWLRVSKASQDSQNPANYVACTIFPS